MKIPRINLLTIAIMCFTAAAVATQTGCATTKPGQVADAGVHADHATTAYGLAVMGATELNPLAPLAPLRYWAIKKAEEHRCADGGKVIRTASAVGWGAGAWNALMLTVNPIAAAVAGVMGGLGGYQLSECEPIPATPEHIAILGQWEKAYESGDVEGLAALMDNEKLLGAYSDLFARTVDRRVEYSDLEAVRGGFIARYQARLAYTDGEAREIDGDIRFEVDEGRVRDAQRI